MSADVAMTGVRTPHGVVWLWRGPERAGPKVFAIRGAFADRDQLNDLAELLPEASLTVAHLPGLIGPPVEASIENFAAAMREVIGHGPVTIVGASVGGLVAMLLSDLGKVIALDPPLSPSELWPLQLWAREAGLSQAQQPWFDAIFGRDYHWVLDRLRQPITCLAAGVPLNPPRPFRSMPGLLSERDRAKLKAHPMVDLEVIEGVGHNLPKDRPDAVAMAIRSAILEPERL